MNLRPMLIRAFILASLLMPMAGQAYFSTMDTGELVGPGEYRVAVEPQFILNKYDGVNMVGHFDTGIDQQSSMRALVGFGEVNFQTGAFYKYVPFPDTENQPAIGGMAGALISRVDGATELSIRFHPLISKRFDTEIGLWTPYASLPIGVTSRKSDTFVPVQLALGTEWKTLQFDNLTFMLEIGMNVHKAFGYFSLAAVYYFDEENLRGK